MPFSRPFELATVGGVRLRTLLLVRWIAIAGQLAGVVVTAAGLGLRLPLAPLLTAIGASAVLNLALSLWRPIPRLNEGATTVLLAWDTVQLAVLLYFTGGLDNPFALMLLAPVCVAATVLSRGHTAALCALAIVAASLLALRSVPLAWEGSAVGLHGGHLVGTWVALVMGSIFFAVYAGWIAAETRRATQALSATQDALAREQRLAAVGALAAATAHELGTPLGTIHLVANELAAEVTPDDPLAEDVALLAREVARCRDILKQLSARTDPDHAHAPLERMTPAALVESVVQRYRRDAVEVAIASFGERIPVLPGTPEVLHGLANVLQNAIQFARSRVEVRITALPDALEMTIVDDGPGFPSTILDHLGEPYLSTRAKDGSHMGLGVFIAITLLERSGAGLDFGNRADGGARVRIRWPRTRLATEVGDAA
ncbi:MAG: ActS/PrrB/RegB family redox-sensitive histidine kinase [Alphaproteobacteria bacterium]